MAQMPLQGQVLFIVQLSKSHSDAPHSVRLLWTSDQPIAETSTWQHTTITRDRNPCLGGIRTRNPRKRVAEDPHLRPRGHRGRPYRGLVLHFMMTVQLAVTVTGQSDSHLSYHYHEPIFTGNNDSQKEMLIICVSN